jgi:hypothetical protein
MKDSVLPIVRITLKYEKATLNNWWKVVPLPLMMVLYFLLSNSSAARRPGETRIQQRIREAEGFGADYDLEMVFF